MNAELKKVKLAIVISHPIQYYVPIYRHLDAYQELDVTVFYVGENGAKTYFDLEFQRPIKWDVPLTEGYRHEFLNPGKVLSDFRFNTVDAPNIVAKLKKFSPDFVWVSGYAHRVVWRCLFGLKGTKFIVSSDSNLDDKRNVFRIALKSVVLRSFYRRMHACISCGPKNRVYLRHYGVQPAKIVDSVLPVDIQALIKQSHMLTEPDLRDLRLDLNLKTDDRVLLFAGKLVPHKRPQDAIYTLKKLIDLGQRHIKLVVVGSGVMKDSLLKLAEQLDVADYVCFTGFINQTKIIRYFVLSDLLLLPSEREPYGLIATETLPFGLPIVAADNIGSVGSVIIQGKNALLYRCGDIHQCARQVHQLLNDDSLFRQFSDASKQMAASHDASVLARDVAKICLGDAMPLSHPNCFSEPHSNPSRQRGAHA